MIEVAVALVAKALRKARPITARSMTDIDTSIRENPCSLFIRKSLYVTSPVRRGEAGCHQPDYAKGGTREGVSPYPRRCWNLGALVSPGRARLGMEDRYARFTVVSE